MGWSIGYDDKWERDIGYGVPATCDEPGCNEEIDRGLAHVCGEEPYGGSAGCGLYFCSHHLYTKLFPEDDENPQLCMRCASGLSPYEPKPDTAEWIDWKLTDDSWQEWRDENPEAVEELTKVQSKIMEFK